MTEKQPPKVKEIEMYPDAWRRFEAAIGAIGRAKPIHHPQSRKKAGAGPKVRKASGHQRKS